MKEDDHNFSVSTNLPVIKCENDKCGHSYALLGYFFSSEFGDPNPHNWMLQADSYFCPYCGVKRDVEAHIAEARKSHAS